MPKSIASADSWGNVPLDALRRVVGLSLVMCVGLFLDAGPGTGQPPAKDQTPPRMRSMPRTDLFGDPLPAGAKARLGTLRWRVSGRYWLAYAPDGKSILVSAPSHDRADFTALEDTIFSVDRLTGQVRPYWHLPKPKPVGQAAKTGRTWIQAVNLASHRVACCALLKDSTHHAPPRKSVFDLTVYDMQSSRRLWSCSIRSADVTWSPSGNALAYCEKVNGNPRFHLLNGATGREYSLLDPHSGSSYSWCFGFSTNGKHFAAVINKDLLVWDAPSAEMIVPRGPLPNAVDNPACLAFSPDSSKLAVPSSDQVAVWDIPRGHAIYRVPVATQEFQPSLAISPDGKLLATAATRRLQVWELATGKEVRQLPVSPPDSLRALTFSADGKELAALGAVTLRRWDVATGRETGFVGTHVAAVNGMAFSTDGRMACTLAEDGIIACWRAGTGKRLWHQPGNLGKDEGCLAVSQEAGTVATLGDQGAAILLTDLHTGRRLRRIALNQPIGSRGNMLTFADCGREVSCLHNSLYRPRESWGRAWSVSTGKQTQELGVVRSDWTLPEFPAYHASGFYSRDGRLFALGDWQRYTYDGDVPTHSPAIPISDRATGQRLSSFAVPHQPNSSVNATWGSFTRDSRSLFVVAEFKVPDPSKPEEWHDCDSGVVFLVEVTTGKEQAHFPLPKSMIGNVNASIDTDGRLVALGDNLGTIRLWDALSNRELARFEGGSGIECLCLSPDGKSLASGLANGTALVWDLSQISRQLEPPARDLSLHELTDLWADLGGEDARKAYRAVYRLAADPHHAVPFLAERIALPAPLDPQRLHRLITDLDAKRFSVRERASKELAGLGARAEQALRRTLANHPSPEVRRRVTTLIAELERRAFSTEEVRALRALKVLEKSASPAARRVIRILAKSDPQGWVAHEAEAALSRLEARAPGSGKKSG